MKMEGYVFRTQKPWVSNLFLYLAPGNALSLMYAFPCTTGVFPRDEYNVNKWIVQAMQRFGVPRSVITLCMSKFASGEWALTGSFLLGALYEADWIVDAGDVDIIDNTPEDRRWETTKELRATEAFKESTSSIVCDLERYHVQHMSHFFNYMLNDNDDDTKKRILQFLYPTDAYMRLSVVFVASFDLEFCRNVFTHGKLTILYPKSVAFRKHCTDIILDDIDSCGKLTEHAEWFHATLRDGRLERYYRRLLKYQLRGFELAPIKLYDSDVIIDHNGKKRVLSRNRYWTTDNVDMAYIQGVWDTFWLDRIDEHGALINMDDRKRRRTGMY